MMSLRGCCEDCDIRAHSRGARRHTRFLFKILDLTFPSISFPSKSLTSDEADVSRDSRSEDPPRGVVATSFEGVLLGVVAALVVGEVVGDLVGS